jgi:hypothetical protein
MINTSISGGILNRQVDNPSIPRGSAAWNVIFKMLCSPGQERAEGGDIILS